MTIKGSITGNIVAEPERKEINGSALLTFPVYSNERRKNRDTGEYENTGNVTKVKVTLWRELAENTSVGKGDLVEVVGSFIEREYDKKDGSKGRSLETSYVESVVVKFTNKNEAPADAGFDSDEGGF